MNFKNASIADAMASGGIMKNVDSIFQSGEMNDIFEDEMKIFSNLDIIKEAKRLKTKGLLIGGNTLSPFNVATRYYSEDDEEFEMLLDIIDETRPEVQRELLDDPDLVVEEDLYCVEPIHNYLWNNAIENRVLEGKSTVLKYESGFITDDDKHIYLCYDKETKDCLYDIYSNY